MMQNAVPIISKITGMNPKASCGVLYPCLCRIIRLTLPKVSESHYHPLCGIVTVPR